MSKSRLFSPLSFLPDKARQFRAYKMRELIKIVEESFIRGYHIVTKRTRSGYVTQFYYIVPVGHRGETLEYFQQERREKEQADALKRHAEFVEFLSKAG